MADNQVVALVFQAKDEASATFGKLSKEMHGLGGTMGSVAGDIGKFGMMAAGAALAGATALAGGLAYATKAAADEQVGIERLNQTLKNNVAGFNGNTKAIDEAIAKREKLAFTDDALRNSLNSLVPRTKDVNEALKLQALAMDLARAKGMDLETASQIIGKVYSGNTAILTRYGIAVDKNASSEQALAAIQAQTAGQAEAYAKTTQGTFEALQIAVNDVIEDIGGALLPVVTQAGQVLSGTLIPAIQDIAGRFSEWVAANQPLIDQVSSFITGALTTLVTTLTGQVIPAFVQILGRVGEFAAKVATDVGPTVVGFATKIGELATIIATKVVPVIVDFAQRVWENGLGKAVKVVTGILGQVLGALIEFVKAILSNETVLKALQTAGELIGKAFGFAADILQTVWDVVTGLARAISSNKTVLDILGAIGRAIGTAFNIAAAAINAVISAIQTAIDIARTAGEVIGGVFGGGKAAGGPVSAGTTYLVGEAGPELFTPASSGTIIPNSALGGGGGAITLNVTVSGAALFDPYGAAAQQLAGALLPGLRREVTRQGMTLA